MLSFREGILTIVAAGAGCLLVYAITEPGRREGRRNFCYGNLRKIGLGFDQYLQDYDQVFPRAWFGHDDGPSDSKTNYKWMDAIFPYVKNEAIFTCPDDRVSRPYHFRSGVDYGSYVMNNAYSHSGDKQTPPEGQSILRVNYASSVALLTDGQNDFQFTWADIAHTPLIVGSNPYRWDSIRGRHGPEIYRAANTLDCSLLTSTAVFGFARDSKVVNGQTIYPGLTIEED